MKSTASGQIKTKSALDYETKDTFAPVDTCLFMTFRDPFGDDQRPPLTATIETLTINVGKHKRIPDGTRSKSTVTPTPSDGRWPDRLLRTASYQPPSNSGRPSMATMCNTGSNNYRRSSSQVYVPPPYNSAPVFTEGDSTHRSVAENSGSSEHHWVAGLCHRRRQ